MIGSRSRHSHPDSLPSLIESLRSSADSSNLMDRPGNVTTMMQTGITQAREFDDPAGLHEKTEFLLREWVNMYHSPQAGRDSFKAFNAFVTQVDFIWFVLSLGRLYTMCIVTQVDHI